MNTPIVLKAADVIAAARKAYEEKRLSAQGPTPMCKYRDESGRPCAIGAAIPDDAYDPLMEGFAAEALGSSVRITAPITTAKLQKAHDSWAYAAGNTAYTDEDRLRRENAFRALIGLAPLPVEG